MMIEFFDRLKAEHQKLDSALMGPFSEPSAFRSTDALSLVLPELRRSQEPLWAWANHPYEPTLATAVSYRPGKLEGQR